MTSNSDSQEGGDLRPDLPPATPVAPPLTDPLPRCPAPLPDPVPQRPPADPTPREIQKPESQPPDYQALLRRLDRVEKQRLVMLFACVVACAASVTCLYLLHQERSGQDRSAEARRAPEPPALEGGTLEVKRVAFLDAAGNRRDSIRLDESGTGIAFCDPNGVKRALFFTNSEGTGWNLLSTDGRQRASIGVLKDGAGIVTVVNEQGRSVIKMSTVANQPFISVQDENQNPSVILDSTGMSLFDGATLRAEFTKTNATTGVRVFDRNGHTRIGMGMTDRGPVLAITAENGNIVFAKP
jgi:hypothetical protein